MKNNTPTVNTPENESNNLFIPVPFKLALRSSIDNRALRLYVLKYCKQNRIAGFEPFKQHEVNFHHNLLYDENGNLKADTPEKTAPTKTDEKEKTINPNKEGKK